MAKFIALTYENSDLQDLHVNIDHISGVFVYEGRTGINILTQATAVFVQESVADVMHLIKRAGE